MYRRVKWKASFCIREIHHLLAGATKGFSPFKKHLNCFPGSMTTRLMDWVEAIIAGHQRAGFKFTQLKYKQRYKKWKFCSRLKLVGSFTQS